MNTAERIARITLCDRLQKQTPCGYGSRFYFEIRGQGAFSKAALIFQVVERFSKIHGPLTYRVAYQMYGRLAESYCLSNYHGVIKALRSHEDPLMLNACAHPFDKAVTKDRLYLARKMVAFATDNADGDYGLWQSASGECSLCGGPTKYTLVSDRLPDRKECDRTLRRQNNYRVCRNAMCRALVEKFPACCSYRNLAPMAFVLKEITKNGDRSGVIDEIKKIAARDVYRVHNRRGRQARGEGCSPAGRGVYEGV